MLGKTHLFLGAITSVSIIALYPLVSYNITSVAISSVIAVTASTLTSQLPDIDVATSQISKTLSKCKCLSNPIASLLYIILALGFTYVNFFLNFSNEQLIELFLVLGILFFFQFILSLFCNKSFGHRRITHTFAFAFLIIGMCYIPYYLYYQGNYLYLNVLIGLSSGIFSHLFYDCLTRRGCPLFMPLLDANIHFLSLKSGKHDYIGIILSIVLLGLCIWLRMNDYTLQF